MPTILPVSHKPPPGYGWTPPSWVALRPPASRDRVLPRRELPLLGHTAPSAGYTLAEYALFMLLGALVVLPALQQTMAVLMQYYQIIVVTTAGG